jgi:hypothetical protein
MSFGVHRCGTPHKTEDLNRMVAARLHERNFENAETPLYVRLKYIIVPTSTGQAEKSKVISQHNYTRSFFLNEPDSSALQNMSTHYPHISDLEKPAISLLPETLTETDIQVTSSSNQSFLSASDALQHAQNDGITLYKGIVYVVVTTLGEVDRNQLLGIAGGIISNVCAVDFRSVGSSNDLPEFNGYTGMTLAHELGHCFGLVHPFMHVVDGSVPDCDSPTATTYATLNPDAPVQRYPNYYVNVSGLTAGSENALDNAGRRALLDDGTNTYNGEQVAIDLYEGDYSCHNGSTYEGFFNIMDYSPDESMVGFFQANVTLMRNVLTNNSYVDFFGDTQSATNGENPSSAWVITDESTGIDTWLIGVICGCGALILGVAIWWLWKKKGSGKVQTVAENNSGTKGGNKGSSSSSSSRSKSKSRSRSRSSNSIYTEDNEI